MNDTATELDALTEAVRSGVLRGDELLQWLAKVRAHAEADEVAFKVMRLFLMIEAAEAQHDPFCVAETARHHGLPEDWAAAPQRAVVKAKGEEGV